MESVNEHDSLLAGRANEFYKLSPLLLGVRFSPALPVIGVVFGRVEVGVHPSLRAERKESGAVRHAPGRTEESLDNAAALKGALGWHAPPNLAQEKPSDKYRGDLLLQYEHLKISVDFHGPERIVLPDGSAIELTPKNTRDPKA